MASSAQVALVGRWPMRSVDCDFPSREGDRSLATSIRLAHGPASQMKDECLAGADQCFEATTALVGHFLGVFLEHLRGRVAPVDPHSLPECVDQAATALQPYVKRSTARCRHGEPCPALRRHVPMIQVAERLPSTVGLDEQTVLPAEREVSQRPEKPNGRFSVSGRVMASRHHRPEPFR